MGAKDMVCAKVGGWAEHNPDRSRKGDMKALAAKVGGWPEQVEEANRAWRAAQGFDTPDPSEMLPESTPFSASAQGMVTKQGHCDGGAPTQFVVRSAYKEQFANHPKQAVNKSRFRTRNADTEYRELALRQFGRFGKGYRD
jgi:hypothetical protein